MPSFLRMPAPAAGVEEATLLEWSVDDGTEFEVSDVLLVIETDKAVIDVEAETAGVLRRKLVTAGQNVAVGTPLAIIGSAGDSDADIDALAAQAQAGGVHSAADDAAGAESPATENDEITGQQPTVDAGPASAAAGQNEVSHDGGTRIFASPIARQMANSAGLSLDELIGTGPGGRIVRWDVEQAVAHREDRSESTSPASPAVSVTPATPAAPAALAGNVAGRRHAGDRGFTDEPHSKVRAAIAARLTESKQTVPHFYVRGTARLDALLAMRKELNAAGGPKISVNDLVVRAVARAHRLVPAANVIFMDTATRTFDYVDVAVAIATDGGLVTPVLRDVDRMPISEISSVTADFAARARSGRLRQHELEGGSITVTNLGMFGVEEFDAIINPPHSAILAVGAARPEPVAVEGPEGPELSVATVMHVVLSVDHRALDGVVAGQWMAALIRVLEHPIQILA